MPQHVLILERIHSGHRLYYVRILATAAHERGSKVTIVLGKGGAESEEARLHLSTLPESIGIREEIGADLTTAARLSHQLKADVTVVPDGDWLLKPLVKARRWRGTGALSLLVMREPNAGPGRTLSSSIKRSGKLLAMRWVASLSRVRLSVLKSATWTGSSEFNVAHDPVTLTTTRGKAAATVQEWGVTPNRYWFSVLGAVNSRKNLPLVVEALSQIGSSELGLFVGGACDPGELRAAQPWIQEFEARGGRVAIVDRLLSDDELDAAVLAVSCIVIAHSNEGPSGLFGKAAAAGTRIVAAGAQSLKGEAISRPRLATWSALAAPPLSEALAAAALSSRPEPEILAGTTLFTDALL